MWERNYSCRDSQSSGFLPKAATRFVASSADAEQNGCHSCGTNHHGNAEASFASRSGLELLGRRDAQFRLDLLNRVLGIGQSRAGGFAVKFDSSDFLAAENRLFDGSEFVFGEVHV